MANMAFLLSRAGKCFKKTGHLMKAFLEAYERTENQSMAGDEVGVGHETVTTWKKNEDFKVLFTASHIRAQQKYNDGLKRTNRDLARHGNPHYVIDKKTNQIVLDSNNRPVIAYREFYPNLNMFMLKNRMPDEFRDKFEHEISGQLIVTLAHEFIAIVRRHTTPETSNSIQKELETLSAKLTTA